MNTVINDLRNVGLSQSQATLYLVLLTHGPLRIQALSEYAQSPRTSVYANIEKLVACGLVEEVVEDSYKIYKPRQVGVLKKLTEQQITQARITEETIDRLEHTLPKLNAAPGFITELKRYKNRLGARQLLWNTLQTQTDVYVYSSWGRSKFVGSAYYASFVRESTARSIKEKVIINSDADLRQSIIKDLGSPTSRTPLNRIWDLPIHIEGETFIYNDTYAQIYLKDDVIHGFEIVSKQFAATQRSIFNILLKIARPIV